MPYKLLILYMSILTWIEEKKRLNLLNAPKYINPASDPPDLLSNNAPRGGRSSKGLWTRCDKCGVILYIKHLKENQRVCFGCTYHLQMSSQERIENLLDKESWRPFDETVSPCDPLEFHDQRNYTDRLRDAQDKTGLQDAIQTGTGLIDGIPVALGIMDFDFMGGSMGSVVGEKITRLIEYATQEGLTLLLVCASGGARMQEGVFSLMQMAKISSALQIYQSCANLLYISILTSPTTGGVTASFAMLGDIIFAEPKALIAFAGRRVIEQTLCEDLPEDFQTSEYMLHHGLVDLIVPRRFLRQALSESIRLYKNAPFKKPGRIPFGVQNPISFLTEEKLRRQCRVELDLGLTQSHGQIKSSVFVPKGLPKQPKVMQDDTLSRQSVEYREILTSFQMMYQLFSKQMSKEVLGLSKSTDPASEGPWTKDKALMSVGPVEEQNTTELDVTKSGPASSQNSVSKAEGANTSTDPSLLQKFRELAETAPFDNRNGTTLSNNSYFLNQALELAATESVEWRAFYVHQTISKTTGFLEDFLSPGQYTELLGSTDKVSIRGGSHSEHAQLQNTLFYRSICRTTIG